MKTLVIYWTHELCDNLDFFLNNGYFTDNNHDFYIAYNEDMDMIKYEKYKNDTNLTNLFFYGKPNVGGDFGAWSEVLFKENDGKMLYEQYDYFIFLNNTCIGPFLPIYFKDKWTDIFINLLDDNTKLVGSSINHYYGRSHVQSYAICTDRIGLDIAIKNKIFTKNISVKYAGRDYQSYRWEFIQTYEIGFSLAILKNNYNIKCLLKGLENIDFRLHADNKVINTKVGQISGDLGFENTYFGMSYHPYEVIFMKTNILIRRKKN